MSATTTQLLSSGEFCKLRYGIIPVKSGSVNVFFSIPITQKCRILNCDTLVASERFMEIKYNKIEREQNAVDKNGGKINYFVCVFV
jgi:hypothetical protein